MTLPRLARAACGLACAIAAAACAPAPRVTRSEAVRTAWDYTQVAWQPDARHVRHGPDARGITVHTPDASIGKRGWWRPGTPAKSMPYKWGGTDTPASFLAAVAAGRPAGDIASPEKRRAGDAAVSHEAAGIDCSGLVSACWKLPRAYSTRELPQICQRLASWDDLKPGDILLNHQHVLLFAKRLHSNGRRVLGCYEAGPYPVWRVSCCGMDPATLERDGYAPWRYPQLADDPQDAPPAPKFTPQHHTRGPDRP